jgi:GT2 family glycosyltransferase
MSIQTLAVLMTSFNRRALTVKSLDSLFRQKNTANTQLTVFLVNDGCTDGTDAAVSSLFPEVNVLQGDGSLFWNGGMRLAFDVAMRKRFDAYLLLNDDTVLYEDTLSRIIACAESYLASGKPAIVVSSTRSSKDSRHSYGGILTVARGLAMNFVPVLPNPISPLSCDTMNGNCVLIPKEVANVLGNLDEHFRHQYGDLDYGLRARRAGFEVVVCPGYSGECNQNSTIGSWRDPSIPFIKRWRHLISPKGVPIKEWFFFTRRHFGWRWPYYVVSPYFKTITSGLLPRT